MLNENNAVQNIFSRSTTRYRQISQVNGCFYFNRLSISGLVAQLVARLLRKRKVPDSNPLWARMFHFVFFPCFVFLAARTSQSNMTYSAPSQYIVLSIGSIEKNMAAVSHCLYFYISALYVLSTSDTSPLSKTLMLPESLGVSMRTCTNYCRQSISLLYFCLQEILSLDQKYLTAIKSVPSSLSLEYTQMMKMPI